MLPAIPTLSAVPESLQPGLLLTIQIQILLSVIRTQQYSDDMIDILSDDLKFFERQIAGQAVKKF